MPVTRRATENVNTTWIPIPEIPLATFVLAKPELRFSETYGNWNVNFGLALHPDLREQFIPKRELPENTQQSDRVFYTCGLSFGYIKDGQYQMPKLVEFMAACFGVAGGKAFRAWMAEGGGSPRPLDRDDDKAELEMIGDWLGWMEGLLVYGSVRHENDKQNPGQVRSRFGGPLPLGSLPGQPEIEYQQLGAGKFRLMRTETEKADHDYEELRKQKGKVVQMAARGGKAAAPALPDPPPAQQYTADGEEIDAKAEAELEAILAAPAAEADDDPPF